VQVASFESKLHETEKKLEESEKARKILFDKTPDADSEINELKNTMQRFVWNNMNLLIFCHVCGISYCVFFSLLASKKS
jgi:hypothetical protein